VAPTINFEKLLDFSPFVLDLLSGPDDNTGVEYVCSLKIWKPASQENKLG